MILQNSVIAAVSYTSRRGAVKWNNHQLRPCLKHHRKIRIHVVQASIKKVQDSEHDNVHSHTLLIIKGGCIAEIMVLLNAFIPLLPLLVYH